jgi:pseudouridine synthase
MSERLNKVISRAGVASRRAADQLIEAGRVRVNGRIIRELGTRVDPKNDSVAVDGKAIPPIPTVHTYLMLHKPKGYVTTMSDPEGRRTIADLLEEVRPRVYPVGRLDYDSEGLLLLVDDGDLGSKLMHPSHEVDKIYMVKVKGTPDQIALNRLRKGIRLDDRPTRPATISMKKRGDNSWLEVTIREGRRRQIRRMFLAVGHRVLKLRRVAYGGLRLGDLPIGALRHLTAKEVGQLRRVSGGAGRRRKGPNRSN